MCGRYSLEFDEEFYTRYKVSNKPLIKTNYNVAPGQTMPVVLAHSSNAVVFMLWGLIPFWEEKKEKPHGLINMRDDTILKKKWAHTYIQSQRCLVPATGFYEWKKTNKEKHPFYFHLKNKSYYSFAGVYSEWMDPLKNNPIRSYAIITTTANSLMEPIHNRMPVILKQEDEDRWLSHDLDEYEDIKQLLKPYSDTEMETYPVSIRVNSPLYNNKEMLKPEHKKNEEIKQGGLF